MNNVKTEVFLENLESNKWLFIPELNIYVTKKVLFKGRSWNELKLSEKEDQLLTVNEVIWLANSKYSDQLNIYSREDHFFIKQPFDKNKMENLIARFGGSGWAFLDCDRDPSSRYDSLGVRFIKRLK